MFNKEGFTYDRADRPNSSVETYTVFLAAKPYLIEAVDEKTY